MVKTILLRLDDELFYKFKDDKLQREKTEGAMTWERYFARIFGLANYSIKVERRGKHGEKKSTNKRLRR